MLNMTLTQILHAVEGRLSHPVLLSGDTRVHGLFTDTRKPMHGGVFVALRGARFDAHEFLSAAVDNGALALIVEQAQEDLDIAQIVVADTRIALGKLAAAWCAIWRAQGGKLVALTGSNGKTTTKEMLASILRQVGSTLATRGNLNNDIGVPLMLAELDASHAFAVIEMGANHAGEIAYLTALARPDVALVTNTGRAHLLGFGGKQGVIRAKGEIFGGLREHGTAVINLDDEGASFWLDGLRSMSLEHASESNQADLGVSVAPVDLALPPRLRLSSLTGEGWGEGACAGEVGVSCEAAPPLPNPLPREERELKARQLSFSLHSGMRADVCGQWSAQTGVLRIMQADIQLDVRLQVVGEHNAHNALAAASAAWALGIEPAAIQAGLESFAGVAGRLQRKAGRGGCVLWDDTYNANPDSLRAGIRAVVTHGQEVWLLLGDMGELGEDAAMLHAEAGSLAKTLGVTRLWTVGALAQKAAESFGEAAQAFATQEDLLTAVLPVLRREIQILIKGSRSSRMENVVQALTAPMEDAPC